MSKVKAEMALCEASIGPEKGQSREIWRGEKAWCARIADLVWQVSLAWAALQRPASVLGGVEASALCQVRRRSILGQDLGQAPSSSQVEWMVLIELVDAIGN